MYRYSLGLPLDVAAARYEEGGTADVDRVEERDDIEPYDELPLLLLLLLDDATSLRAMWSREVSSEIGVLCGKGESVSRVDNSSDGSADGGVRSLLESRAIRV